MFVIEESQRSSKIVEENVAIRLLPQRAMLVEILKPNLLFCVGTDFGFYGFFSSTVF